MKIKSEFAGILGLAFAPYAVAEGQPISAFSPTARLRIADSQHLITLKSPIVNAIGFPLGIEESKTSPLVAKAPVYCTFAVYPVAHWDPVPWERTLMVIPPSIVLSAKS